jgi:plastocyanin
MSNLFHRRLSANQLAIYGLVLILLALAFATIRIAKNRVSPPPTTTQMPAQQTLYDERINDPNKTFAITVDEGQLVKGPEKIIVKIGDSVRVNLTALGEEARVHLEGYDIITEHDPSDNVPGGFSFIADRRGTFKYYSLAEPGIDGTISTEKTLLGSIVVE